MFREVWEVSAGFAGVLTKFPAKKLPGGQKKVQALVTRGRGPAPAMDTVQSIISKN